MKDKIMNRQFLFALVLLTAPLSFNYAFADETREACVTSHRNARERDPTYLTMMDNASHGAYSRNVRDYKFLTPIQFMNGYEVNNLTDTSRYKTTSNYVVISEERNSFTVITNDPYCNTDAYECAGHDQTGRPWSYTTNPAYFNSCSE